MNGKKISKSIIMVVYCVAVFLLSLLLMGKLLNRGNTDMTMEMADPMYPLITLTMDGMDYNQMQGFVCDMDLPRMRDHLTPIGSERNIQFRIDTYGNAIDSISYQLRSLGEGRLIEDTKLYNYVMAGEAITGDIVLKDLIKSGVEYGLRINLTLDNGAELYYFTHVIRNDACDAEAMLDFVYSFSNATFTDEAALKLPVYLESNAQGDNSSFANVDIHSSLSQISWGELNPEKVTGVKASIKEIDEELAEIILDYMVSTGEEPVYYEVNEYFRIRVGAERMHLLDYNRKMEQVFETSKSPVINSKIILGIGKTDINKKESNDGSRFAFVNARHLFVYDVMNNRLSDVFGFYHKDIKDRRETSDKHQIKIIRIDELGNVTFVVYGYMNCGLNEGRMGLAVYYYDASLNAVEEKQFISYDGCFELLDYEVSRLCFVDTRNSTYMILKDRLLEIKDNNIHMIAEGLKLKGFAASDSSRMAIWSESSDLYHSDKLTLMDMQTGAKKTVTAEAGELLMPLGFFGDDAIYGVARAADVSKDNVGHTVFPMYRICIVNSQNTVQKQYENEGIYVTEAVFEAGMMRLTRVRKDGAGGYTDVADDQILNNMTNASGRNIVETVITEKYETMVQIALKSEVKTESLKIMEPRQVLFEGERRAQPEENLKRDYYILYRYGHLYKVFEDAYDAVDAAVAEGGTIRNSKSQMIYHKMTLPVKNQIMAIKGNAAGSAEKKGKLAACLDEILKFEGVQDSSRYRLSEGTAPADILSGMIDRCEPIDISGCILDVAVYFIGNEKPVFMETADGAMLLIGYNEIAVVVMDPENGEVYKVNRKDLEKQAETEGLKLLAYAVREE
ncbi:MAG: hypothetical protein K5686_09395 [Lachnospiraceae bacterium]|nr:hypothetical protein [Lachnospiraceae bacterium]